MGHIRKCPDGIHAPIQAGAVPGHRRVGSIYPRTLAWPAHCVPNATPLIYENIVPQKWNEEFCFHRKDFVQALKYLLACVGKADKPYVRFDNGALTLRTKECLYKAAVSISVESSIVFGFDARFMLDALTQFEKQELVTMRLTSPLGAISLIAGNSSAIVLPVRLKEEQKAA